jgi:hypothetical protein
MVGYGPFSLCAIHKEDLFHSSGNMDRLMMMMMIFIPLCKISVEDNYGSIMTRKIT